MLLDALEEARAQITAIFSTMANIAPTERNRLYQDVGIGRHVRHIVDHFNALKNRTQTAALVDAGRAAKAAHVDAGRAAKAALALIDYNQRSRDSDIERDFELGQSVLQSLAQWLAAFDPATLNQAVQVRAEISCSHTENGEFQSDRKSVV